MPFMFDTGLSFGGIKPVSRVLCSENAEHFQVDNAKHFRLQSSIWTQRCRCVRATRGIIRRANKSQVGVASDRVYSRAKSPERGVSSYLAFPSLPHLNNTAVYFCCTLPEVAFGGRYPLSCPAKPGLSS